MNRFVILILSLFISSCSSNMQTAPGMPPSTPQPVPVAISLRQVVDALKRAKLPMTGEVIYDERSDPNGLLGRPGRYVEKMNFTDSRIKQKFKPMNEEQRQSHLECSIEIFKNKEDAQVRNDYLAAVGKTAGMFDNYRFLHENVLLRIDLDLVPTEADEYKRVLESIK